MTGAGWRIRPGKPDDRELLASFACADQAIRWQAEVNATLKASLGNVADEAQRVDDLSVRLRPDLRPTSWRTSITPAPCSWSRPALSGSRG
jgi:hypothetical protein